MNNPPAFPVTVISQQSQFGMELRDYFAAAAMQAAIRNFSGVKIDEIEKQIARVSYIQADAMLKAREQ